MLVRDKLLNSIEELIHGKSSMFLVEFRDKEHHMDYDKISTMSLKTIEKLIIDGKVCKCRTVETVKPTKTKTKKPAKTKEVDSGYKTNLNLKNLWEEE